MQIEIVPCLTDNYAYLIKSGEYCAVLDPSEATPVKRALDRLGWRPGYILNTHHHNDHVGGNLELKALYGAEIVGPGKDAARIAGAIGGAIAGRKIQEAQQAKKTEVRTETQCETINDTRYEVVAYDIVYSYDGQTYTARVAEDPGEKIKLPVRSID